MYTILAAAVVVYSFISDDSLHFEFCITEKCLGVVQKYFPVLLGLTSWFFTAIGVIATILAVMFAARAYENSKKTNDLNNHINNLRFFVEHIEKELRKLSRIDSASVDSFEIYKLIFPYSINGDFTTSIEYYRITKDFRGCLIKTANDFRKKSNFDYRRHQGEIIRLCEKLGISMIHMHESDFYSVEDDVIKLVDSITNTFTALDFKHKLGNINRHYR